MAAASQLQLQLKEELDAVKAEIQQTKQDLRAAEDKGDQNAVAFQRKQLEQLRKQLEQLGEEKLILLRAPTAGQLCSRLAPNTIKHRCL